MVELALRRYNTRQMSSVQSHFSANEPVEDMTRRVGGAKPNRWNQMVDLFIP